MGFAPGQRQVSGMSDSASPAEKLEKRMLAGAAFLAPLLSIFAPLGMAPLFAVSAIALLAGDMIVSRGMPRRTFFAVGALAQLRGFALLAGMLCLWMLASAAWAIAPRLAIENLLQVVGLLGGGIIILAAAFRLSEPGRRDVQLFLLIGICLALAVYLIERFAGAPIGHLLRNFSRETAETIYSPYNRGLSVFMLMAFALIVGLAHGNARLLSRRLSIAVAMAIFFALLIVISIYYGSSLVMASAAALGVFLLGLILPRMAPWIIGACMALYVLAAPLLPPWIVPKLDLIAISEATHGLSISHRFAIWQFSAERIAQKPLSGWGMNSARVMPGAKETIILSYENGAPSARGELLPLHTHNAALQWWLELGMPGALLALSLWIMGLAAIGRNLKGRLPRAFALGGTVGAFAVANLSYGAWQSWWIASLLFAAGFVVLSTTPGRSNA